MMHIREARIGIVIGSPGWRDPGGRVWINHAQGRLIDAICDQVPQSKALLPMLPQRSANQNYRLQLDSSQISDLPPLANTIKAQFYFWSTRRILKKFAGTVDALFIRLPFQVPDALIGITKPTLLHVVGNPRAVVAASTDYRGLVGKFAGAYAGHYERVMKRLVSEQHIRTATNGQEMWDLLRCKRGRVVVSSCLSQAEIRPRSSLALGNPPRLLFVGYLRPEKGVGTLLDAFEQLRAKRPVTLTLVGGPDRPTAAEGEIMDRIKRSPYREDIKIRGMMDYGEELFETYHNHDIYILPSLSEGTPRTLVEARAFGCAVVASRVGGVPSSVEDRKDGLLIEPGNPVQLADAIQELLDNDPFRIELIRRGLERTAEFTLERFTEVLVEELDLALQGACCPELDSVHPARAESTT